MMAASESDTTPPVRARLAIEQLENMSMIDVGVCVERLTRGRCALVLDTGGARWRLTLSPAAAAYVSGLLAAGAGVRFE